MSAGALTDSTDQPTYHGVTMDPNQFTNGDIGNEDLEVRYTPSGPMTDRLHLAMTQQKRRVILYLLHDYGQADLQSLVDVVSQLALTSTSQEAVGEELWNRHLRHLQESDIVRIHEPTAMVSLEFLPPFALEWLEREREVDRRLGLLPDSLIDH